jgi:hypothetical protein
MPGAARRAEPEIAAWLPADDPAGHTFLHAERVAENAAQG